MANLKCVSINQPSDWRLFFVSFWIYISCIYIYIYFFPFFFFSVRLFYFISTYYSFNSGVVLSFYGYQGGRGLGPLKESIGLPMSCDDIAIRCWLQPPKAYLPPPLPLHSAIRSSILANFGPNFASYKWRCWSSWWGIERKEGKEGRKEGRKGKKEREMERERERIMFAHRSALRE